MYTDEESGNNKKKKIRNEERKKMKKIQTKNAGITLVALIITIIVMLILAGITINLTIGQNGILKRAEEAGKNHTNATNYEKNQLAEFSNRTDKIIENVTGIASGRDNEEIERLKLELQNKQTE